MSINKKKNHTGVSGQSLISVMIALGITTMIALAITQLTTSGGKAQKNLQTLGEFSNLMSLVQAMQADPTTCTSMLTGTTSDPTPLLPQNGSSTSLNGLKLPNGSWLFQNDQSRAGLFTLSSITLAIVPGTNCLPNTTCQAALTVQATKSAAGTSLSYGNNSITKTVNLTVVVDNTNHIQKCGQATAPPTLGQVIIIPAGTSNGFLNTYGTSVTATVQVQAAGGGGSQGGGACQGNNPGYKGGDGAFYQGQINLLPGDGIQVQVGTGGIMGWNSVAQWGEDARIWITSNSSIIETIIVEAGKAYGGYSEYNQNSNPYVFSRAPIYWHCPNWTGITNPCSDGSNITPTVIHSPATTPSDRESSPVVNSGTVCVPMGVSGDPFPHPESYYNLNLVNTYGLGSFGYGGLAGWGGTNHIQSNGQDGVAILKLN